MTALRDELAGSGQSLLAVRGQILVSADNSLAVTTELDPDLVPVHPDGRVGHEPVDPVRDGQAWCGDTRLSNGPRTHLARTVQATPPMRVPCTFREWVLDDTRARARERQHPGAAWKGVRDFGSERWRPRWFDTYAPCSLPPSS